MQWSHGRLKAQQSHSMGDQMSWFTWNGPGIIINDASIMGPVNDSLRFFYRLVHPYLSFCGCRLHRLLMAYSWHYLGPLCPTHTHTHKLPQLKGRSGPPRTIVIVNGQLCKAIYAPDPPVDQVRTRFHWDRFLACLCHFPHSLTVLAWRIFFFYLFTLINHVHMNPCLRWALLLWNLT